jgi:hypothetical protein
VRYKWGTGDAFELHFYEPDRAKTVADFTIPASEYLRVTELRPDDANVRNVGKVKYVDGATGIIGEANAIDSGSVAIYGRRYLEINEDSSSNIDSQIEAQIMINAAIADTAIPFANHRVDTYYLWPVELGDLIAFPANDLHYDSEQKFAVMGFTVTIENGEAIQDILTRGKPAGAYTQWIRKHGKGPVFGTGIPAPLFSFLLGEGSHGGGVTGDGMVWVGFKFEKNTAYIEFWGEQGDDANVPTPDISDITRLARIHRPEGDYSQQEDWSSFFGSATTPGKWKKSRACGFGWQNQKGPDWIPPPVRAIDPVPTPIDGVITGFSVVSGTANENVISVTPGTIDPAGGNFIVIRRDGVDIITEFIDADASQRFLYDRGINPNAAHTYHGFIWNNGVSGKHRRHGAGLLTSPNFTWAQQAPKLVYDTGTSRYLVALYWQLTGFPTAHHIVFEYGKNGVNFPAELGQTSTGSTVFTDVNTKAKWYRMRLEDVSNNILAYSPAAYWDGQGVPPSWGTAAPPEWNPVPTATILRSSTLTIGVPSLVMGFICPTSGAVTCAIEGSADGATGWTVEYESGQLSGDQWIAGPGIPARYFRLVAKDAAGATLATSTVEYWPGFV